MASRLYRKCAIYAAAAGGLFAVAETGPRALLAAQARAERAPLVTWKRSLGPGSVVEAGDVVVVRAHPELRTPSTYAAARLVVGKRLRCSVGEGEPVVRGCLE